MQLWKKAVLPHAVLSSEAPLVAVLPALRTLPVSYVTWLDKAPRLQYKVKKVMSYTELTCVLVATNLQLQREQLMASLSLMLLAS